MDILWSTNIHYTFYIFLLRYVEMLRLLQAKRKLLGSCTLVEPRRFPTSCTLHASPAGKPKVTSCRNSKSKNFLAISVSLSEVGVEICNILQQKKWSMMSWRCTSCKTEWQQTFIILHLVRWPEISELGWRPWDFGALAHRCHLIHELSGCFWPWTQMFIAYLTWSATHHWKYAHNSQQTMLW